jgi:signal transduction histidine kinase/DNA-binding response OmpR family regulator
MLEEDDGGLWVGTNGGGLNYLDRKAGISRYYQVRDTRLNKSNNIVRALAKDNRGNMWVGTFDGLYRFEKSSGRFEYVKLADSKDSRVISVLEDPEGVWVATLTGGIQFLGYNGVNRIYQADADRKDALKDNNITVLRRDAQNNILVGTENGLNYLDTKTHRFSNYRNDKSETSLSNNSILSVFQDSKQRIWIGTEGGLNYFDVAKKRFHRFKLDAGASNDVVLAIVEDKRGHLWLNTNKGIVELIMKSPGSPSPKSIVQTVNYTVTSGLSSTHFLGAAIRSKDGELLFGGMSGITRFFPDKIVKNNYRPNVVFTEFLIENRPVRFGVEGSPLKQSITETTEITLQYNQNYISFRYAGLNYINPEHNQYAYKLKGISGHQGWSYVGNQRVASFTNLEPGEYVFMVKASNNDGVWNNRPTVIKITVLPPLWKTWWAYLIYFLLSAGILFIIFRFIRNRALLKRDLYLEHVQNERQQELYQMKLNFFTNISHEIRTPLTLIIGPLERLLQDRRYEGIHKQLNVVKNNADRLMKLITELLDFRKAEEGHMKVRCASQDLIPFCQRIFDSFTELASQRGIRYHFHSEVQELELYFDEAQMEKVIMNLLSNAFKFTDDNGEISLRISTRQDQTEWVDIRITDNGRGIPEDFHEKLFESFFQVDDRGRQNIGSGIGLALSKSIVEKHKGTISVQSHENGLGLTVFSISLRRGSLHLEDADILANTPVILKPAPQLPDQTVQADPGPERVSEATAKPYTILLAEDNEEVRGLIADCLKDDYNIVEFSNGAEALKYMEQEIPDLIVSDIMMPEVDGLQLCDAVKSAESTSHIPVILLTARASLDHQVEGLSTGANAYISKPFNPQILTLNIRNLLAAQELMRQKFTQQLILEPSVITVESPEHKFLNRLMEVIDARMADSDFGVEELVKEMNMSRTVLYKKVQSITGFSVADLVKNMRLKKAAVLFSQTSMNVSEVAYQVGFNDRKHFSREFRKFHQLSPSEYIKKVKEESLNGSDI